MDQPEDIIYASGSTLGNFAKLRLLMKNLA